MKDSPSCTADELAKLLGGITSRRVQQLATDGVIVKRGRGRYDLFKSVTGYIRFLQERTLGGGNAGPIDYHTEKARLTKAQADLAEIDAAKASGELVPVAQVERAWSNFCAETRVRARNIPERVVSSLVGCTDEREIKALLLREIDQVLTDMSDADALIEPTENDEAPEDEQV